MELPTAKLLTWYEAAALAIVLVVLAMRLRRARSARLRLGAPFAQEAAYVATLYSTWMLAGSVSKHSVAGAFERARWIDQAERLLHLPAEQGLQRPLFEHPALGEAANLYYGLVHLPSMGLLLFWLFWRHRPRYAPIRTLIAVFTLLSTCIQLIGVAPPRLLPELGFLDIAAHYHQSMYEFAGFTANDLLAMPSVHVGWAVLIAGAVIVAGTHRLRWLILLHPIITVYVVTATGNHWWLDSVGSVILIGLILGARSGWIRWRALFSADSAAGIDAGDLIPVGSSSAEQQMPAGHPRAELAELGGVDDHPERSDGAVEDIEGQHARS